MVGRSWRRPAVDALKEQGLSQHRACYLAGMTENGYRYRRKPSVLNEAILQRMRELARKHPRYGFPRLHYLVCRDIQPVNRKRVYRLYVQNNLQVRQRRRAKRKLGLGERGVLPAAERPNQVWVMDFIEDRLLNGRKYRCLNIEDVYTRELLECDVALSIGGARVTRVLDMVCALRGAPEKIVSDNGSEFTSKAVMIWTTRTRTAHHFIDPEKPMQNGYMESLNGKMRDEHLNAQMPLTINEAKQMIEDWRNHYNNERPHSSLKNLTPREYALKQVEKLTFPTTQKMG